MESRSPRVRNWLPWSLDHPGSGTGYHGVQITQGQDLVTMESRSPRVRSWLPWSPDHLGSGSGYHGVSGYREVMVGSHTPYVAYLGPVFLFSTYRKLR